MQRTFEDTKIFFPSSIRFSERLQVVAAIMSSKVLRTAARDLTIPVYTLKDGAKVRIGTVKDFRAKIQARCVMETKMHIYADIRFETEDPDILLDIDTYVNNHNSKYRLTFIKSFIVNGQVDPSEMVKGLVIRFNV